MTTRSKRIKNLPGTNKPLARCSGSISFSPLVFPFPETVPNFVCCDALARIEGGCILIEAKSHVAEIYGAHFARNDTRSWRIFGSYFEEEGRWRTPRMLGTGHAAELVSFSLKEVS